MHGCPSTQVDSRYHYLLFVSQAENEQVLREAIERRGVVIERSVELIGLSQDMLSHDASPVKVVLRHADGRLEQAQASYLISAEGAHRARATLDLQFEGKTRDEQYALVARPSSMHLSLPMFIEPQHHRRSPG